MFLNEAFYAHYGCIDLMKYSKNNAIVNYHYSSNNSVFSVFYSVQSRQSIYGKLKMRKRFINLKQLSYIWRVQNAIICQQWHAQLKALKGIARQMRTKTKKVPKKK